MSDEANNAPLIRSLEARIAALEGENKKLSAEAAKRRQRGKELQEALDAVTAERDELAAGFDALDAEHAEFKERSAQPESEKDQRIAELENQLRTRDHKETFRELAKKANVREDALNDLWDLSGYKAETDQADEATLGELIAAKLKGRDYLLKPVETTTAAADAATPNAAANGVASAAITTPATKPGPGAVRTTSDTTPPAARTAVDRVNAEFAKHSITGVEGRI